MAQKAMKSSWLKGIFAIVASVVLVCVCATSAFAASGSLKVVAEEGSHSYQAYKLFACDVNADGTISNISTYGCMSEDFYADAFASSRPQEMAEEVSRQINGPGASAHAASLSRTVVAHGEGAAVREFQTGVEVTLDAGVYLLISHDAQPILVTIGGEAVVVNEKSTLPSVLKEVACVPTVGAFADSASFGQVAMAGASRQLVFRVTGTLPSNYEAFDTYRYAFVDTPGKGLVIDPSSLVVTLIDNQGQETTLSQGYTVSYDQGVFRVVFDDLKQSVPAAAYGSKVVLTYRATLDPKLADLGFNQGNPNSVSIEYRRSPSYEEIGTTKPSVTTTYSFALSLVKVDSADSQKLLSGARFELRDEQGICIAAAVTDEAGALRIAGIAPGKYQLKEIVPPSGYVVLSNPITVEISADAETRSLTASVASDAAKVVNVDAGGGEVSLSVANEQITTGIFSRTGDAATGVLLGLATVAIVAGVLIVALLPRRRHRRDEGAR